MSIFVDGKYVASNEAKISLNDRGFLFGDGVFSTLLVQDGHIEFYDLHMQRIYSHSKQINLSYAPIEKKQLETLISLNKASKGLYRLKIIISGGEDRALSLKPREGKVIMMLSPYNPPKYEPLKLAVFPDPICSPLAKIKSLAYLPRLYLCEYAATRGFDDAITLSPEGYLLEAIFANLFWVKEDALFYPDFSLPLVEGIMLKMILKAADGLGMRTYPVKKRLEDIDKTHAFYLSNSLKNFLPIVKIEEMSYPRNLSFEKKLNINLQKLKIDELRS